MKPDKETNEGRRGVVWEGDLEDDCTACVGQYEAHCECLGVIGWDDEDEHQQHNLEHSEYWHCAVYRVDSHGEPVGDAIFHSGEPGGLILGGSMARAIAEAILKSLRTKPTP